MPNAPQIKTDYFAFEGGLNLVSPALLIPPGTAIDSMNYEPSIYGGYSRLKGKERFDGRASPSSADYWNMAVALSATVNVGDTVTGAISGATAIVLQVNGTTELIVTRLTGTFVTENITVAAAVKGTVSLVGQNSGTTPLLHAQYKSLAANSYRSLIGMVPGSGPVRGVKYYNGSVYAFRDNAGATACIMYKSSTSGWTAVTFGREIQFTTAIGQINEGDTVTGGTSGATAIVRRALLRTGTWTVSGVGTLVFDTVTGVFQNGELLKVGGVTKATASTADTAISLLPGGRFQFDNNNFSGTLATYRMYGCDGVNFAFEFDGTRLVPIRTGITPDAPKYLAVWKNMLVVAVASSVQVSSIGNPYAWTAITGAAELALGDICTGLLPQIGNADNGAIAIFTLHKTYILYGTSTADFQLVLQSPDAGSQPYTSQNIGYAYYLDTKGVVQINSTQAFGNFEMATITRVIQPLIDSKRGMATASCIVRSKNQYRIFFSDGTGIALYMVQQQTGSGAAIGSAAAIMPFDYGSDSYINDVDAAVDTLGIEHLYAAGSNGYVYELERGTSMDGSNITAHMILSFNNNKTPRSRKHYKRVILQAQCAGLAQVNVGYDLSYAGVEADSGLRSLSQIIGSGGYWDQVVWDQFNWDSPVVQEYKVDTPGNGLNIGILIYSDNAIDNEYTISSAIINYIINRLER